MVDSGSGQPRGVGRAGGCLQTPQPVGSSLFIVSRWKLSAEKADMLLNQLQRLARWNSPKTATWKAIGTLGPKGVALDSRREGRIQRRDPAQVDNGSVQRSRSYSKLNHLGG